MSLLVLSFRLHWCHHKSEATVIVCAKPSDPIQPSPLHISLSISSGDVTPVVTPSLLLPFSSPRLSILRAKTTNTMSGRKGQAQADCSVASSSSSRVRGWHA
ncbi:hypothetical protein FB451DRAFT_1409192 [Mycena latifolia]|nr:hypothetical protein FB451DRAFT_1409192 [Mycena latifolia]